MQMREVSTNQFSGCLIGQCLGDALGFVAEGHGPEACRGYVDTQLRQGRAGQLGRLGYEFGQYTDDSQLARELLQSFVACGQFDPADYAQRIAAIFTESRIVGRGRATEQAAQRLAAGTPWTQAGAPPPSAGNGSAMRAGPVGLLALDDANRRRQIAIDQGRITHADPRCNAGSVAIAGAVSLAARQASVDTAQFVGQLRKWTEPVDESVTTAIDNLHQWLELTPEQAADPIARLGFNPAFGNRWQGISPFVTSSVLWSLYSFLKTPGDYWETICTAIAVGGDVDTTAAMAGAISGAHLGLDALPQQLTTQLNDQGTWGYAELVELAERTAALCASAC